MSSSAMTSFLRCSVIAALVAFILAPPASFAVSAKEIRPPFGMAWGLEFQRVEESVRIAGGHVVEKVPGGIGTVRWSVEGIPQEGLLRTIFTFESGRLQGVELQYGSAEWDTPMYDEFMRRVKAGLDAEHGGGRLLVRERTPGAGVLKTMLGYSWTGSAQSVALIYFAAQDEQNLFRLLSLHYSAKPARNYPQVARRS